VASYLRLGVGRGGGKESERRICEQFGKPT